MSRAEPVQPRDLALSPADHQENQIQPQKGAFLLEILDKCKSQKLSRLESSSSYFEHELVPC